MPTISFLILTYNSAKHIDAFFDSFFSHFKQKIEEGEYELVIVDNNSTDSSFDDIKKYLTKNNLNFTDSSSKKNFPITLVKSKENLGYANGINLASALARGKLLAVINPDATIVKEDFRRVINFFDTHPAIAAAGLKLEDFQGKAEKSAGKFYDLLTFFAFSVGLENMFGVRFSPTGEQKVDFVSGGFIVFDHEKFDRLGQYDKNYFMYIEDMDFCFRAHRKGYEVWFLPYATIRHWGQGSSNREFAIVNIYKGLKYFFRKNNPKVIFYVTFLLKTKAIANIIRGVFFNNKELRDTYLHALKV